MTGCATDGVGFGTFTGKLGGVCDAFERPAYQVLGKTPYDQEWVDKTTEAGVAGCKWQRPEARPAALDAPAAVAPAKPAPPKKLTVWSRVKSKFKKRPD
ncbi:MAG: hypothetical protein ACXWLZ_03600 [Rhizomicrobium sp.]